MPTEHVLARVRFLSESGLPEDEVNNDWCFFNPTGDLDGQYTYLAETLRDEFYNHVSASGRISGYLGESLDRAANAVTVDFYDIDAHLDGEDLGSPIETRSFTLGASSVSDQNLPTEVAVAMSFHGDLTGILEREANPTPPPAFFRPASRRRGRIFLGPLNQLAVGENAAKQPIVSPDFRAVIAAAASNFLSNVTPWWRVWSRADEATYEVVAGDVDDAFDTQRRRGQAATVRTHWL